MNAQDLFRSFVGTWEGPCRTWFEPNKLADESRISAEISEVFGGSFLRHTYQGMIQNKPRHGEELLAYNAITQLYQSSWVDDFHMSSAILFSEGRATPAGFSVNAEYDTGPETPRWGWRTEYHLVDADHLTITAWNVFPDGTEYQAVQTVYQRVQ